MNEVERATGASAREHVALSDTFFDSLDRVGPVPLYFQMALVLRAAIEQGALGPGVLLESVSSISARFGVSRGTVTAAMRWLEDTGVVVTSQGRGTFVCGASGRAQS